ncbi:IclR family transcriptional regulator [Haloarchaeobius sp. TZWSO28]|uniref:IclR family transcriptional regulator n=1 Tax=Haloarchaeobius sp. TZWSO28 TaxID=3446119 RepID=UPI003EB7D70D
MASSPQERTRGKRIQAVERTFEIIDVLRETGGAGVTEISNRIGVSKGTVYNHLATLADDDYVVKDANDQYRLGLRFIDVAHNAMSEVSVLDLARTEVDKLAEKSSEIALFAVEEHGICVTLYVARGADAVQTSVYVGHRDHLHHTAVGKAILAHLPRERVDEIVDQRGLPGVTEHTISERDELERQLEEVRKRGIAFNEQETIPGLVGVGAPILNQTGDVMGALSIVGPFSRIDEDRFYQELPDMITRSVNLVEVNATSIGSNPYL